MKKHYLKLQVIISAFLLLFAAQSCRKESFHEQQNGRMVPVETEAKTGNQYVLFCFMGHDASKCPGCLCIGGVLTHVDCQGAGDACRNSSCVSLTSTGTDLCATTVDTFGFTSLDILNMPSRSFSLETDPGVYSYLNIPAQLVYRDSTTLQFTFTGLSFTNKPLYSNNQMYASHISRTHRKFGEEGAAAWPADGGTGNSGYARRNEGRTDTPPREAGKKKFNNYH